MSRDRRQHRRKSKFLEFTCFIDGQKFTTKSMDISAGGAYVDSEEELRNGAVVMIVPSRELKKKLPIVLVGSVVRRADETGSKFGIMWHKCVTRDGIDNIFDFLAFYLDLYPSALPVPDPAVVASTLASYDFIGNRFVIPQLN